MASTRTLVIRADASAAIGTGHVMRCLALAQAWQDTGGRVAFVLAWEAPVLEARLHSEGALVIHLGVQPGSEEDAARTAACARQLDACWVVVDGYHFGAEYQRIVKEAQLPLLFVDDYNHAGCYYADLVLNQNPHASEELYRQRQEYTRLLLGPRYALLRREFWRWRGCTREAATVGRKLLVTLGGADPNNVTLRVIHALRHVQVEAFEAVVVVGASNPHLKQLHAAVQGSAHRGIRLEHNVTDMSDLMAWADVAVSAGGSTCWEMAFMGLPSLILVLADNQYTIAEELSRAQVGISLGWHEGITPSRIGQQLTRLLTTPELCQAMARYGQRLVDGEGSARVLMRLRRETLRLTRAERRHARLVWEWANDPDARQASFSSDPIPWDQHVKWFEAKLADPRCVFFIAVDGDDTPVGQVRFDLEACDAVVSVSIDPRLRGRGYGSAILRLSSQELFKTSEVNVIHAYVKQGNEASLHAFERAGYQSLGPRVMRGHPAVNLAVRRNAV